MKTVYFFGDGKADGSAYDKNILGGKGANLAEMTTLGIPVPPGFTISTDVCTYFMQKGEYPADLTNEVENNLHQIESIMGHTFGDSNNPLLVSVRSGARQSMPGMMETVLNIGLTSQTIPGLIQKSGDERFAYDAYRRLITMYADVVMEKAADIELGEGEGIREKLEALLENLKLKKKVKNDADLGAEDLKCLCEKFKETIKTHLGQEFPNDPHTQLWGGVTAVFKSWHGKRAAHYRNIENIPSEWGTAVNIQAMVFGNMGEDCATGVAFTRNPATGENKFYGEWLQNAQGEDVVAGLRTPNPLNESSRIGGGESLPTLENNMPTIYAELAAIQQRLEIHYHDMQDIEFTIQNGRLWMLQTRTGKRNGAAAIRMAMEMLESGMIDEETAIMRVNTEQLDEIMHPTLDTDIENSFSIMATGLPAGPGGASGQIVFTADDAENWHNNGKKVILVRKETSPEDIHGMYASQAVLTARGGMTSHAALVARGWGKCCVVGCSEMQISTIDKTLSSNGTLLKEGDWITLNGSTGNVYAGEIPLKAADLQSNIFFKKLMKLADKHRAMGVRTNADSPIEAKQALEFGAQGIGLCRTEHMFFNPERIMSIREMIIAENEEDRRKAIMKLLPHQKSDFYEILKTMAPYPVTIRLLDPPLHEFLPQENSQIQELAQSLKMSRNKLDARIEHLHELNPMLGHRGCRLGISYPEITEMQAKAIFEATAELIMEGIVPHPEVMVPLVGSVSEFIHQRKIIDAMANQVQEKNKVKIDYLVGTMIELPRACATADKIAKEAEFFSFGTNDLTQTAFGFSRDDIGSFLPDYLEQNILPGDPFQSIDKEGVGSLVTMGVEKGRSVNAKLKIGICGEHGGDPQSIHFFQKSGLDYVSCSPFRVPIARLAAAQAEAG
ncbi:MAG: pyruvate, phosphate dikinase [Candidatus Marinimicrobia bacterium]|jgi:pyruvate,orthophosphate dikinase|nr:pyruvate, phosphate dikinase [Candidatus Neomarinimicrobiota bacterium]